MKNVTKKDIENLLKGAKNRQELKGIYRRLAFSTHPDKGGDEELFKFVNSLYEKLVKIVDFDKKTEKPTENSREFTEVIKKFVEIVPNGVELTLEFRGSWIWVSKNDSKKVYSFKNDLKSIGFKWSRGNNQWYWKPSDENEENTTKCYKYIKGAKEKYSMTKESVKGEKVDTKKLK